jgi:hypothetical protein
MKNVQEILSIEEAEAKKYAQDFYERTAHLDQKNYELHNVDEQVANGSNASSEERMAYFASGQHLNEEFLRNAAAI